MKKLLIAIVAILFLSGCGKESEAKKTAEEYMDAVKQGDEFAGFEATEGFIDVFDYDYLQTLEETKEKHTQGYTYELWESVYGDVEDPLYPTFDDYKKSEIEFIESQNATGDQFEIIQNDDEVFEYWDGKSYNEVFKFLYNVEIANEAGQKVFKKAEITVKEGLVIDKKNEDYEEGYIISGVYIR